jgi:hypothetical protein
MEMDFVMTSIMYRSVTMMMEIAVYLMEIIGITFAINVNVFSLAVGLPKIMEMDFVMISIMYPSVTMMMEIAVHLMEIIGITSAKYVNVFSLI